MVHVSQTGTQANVWFGIRLRSNCVQYWQV